MTAVSSTMASLRSIVEHRLEARRQQRQLERELANYRTPNEREELNAILARHTAEESEPVARIIRRHLRTHGLSAR